MTDCILLSDRMPAVAQGEAQWSAVDEAHLAACPDCAAEWAIVRQAAASGRKVVHAIDSSRMTDRVLAGLRVPEASPVTRRPFKWAVPLALAAGLALVLLRLRVPEVPPVAETTVLSLLPEAETLSDADLESLLRLIPVADPADPGVTETLTDEEITQMLQDLEG